MAKAKGTRTRKTTFTQGHAVRERVRQGGEERVTAHAELPLAAGRPLHGRNFRVGEEHEVDDPGGRITHIAGLGRVRRSVLNGEGKARVRGPVALGLFLEGAEPVVEAGERLGEEGCQARGTRLWSRSRAGLRGGQRCGAAPRGPPPGCTEGRQRTPTYR